MTLRDYYARNRTLLANERTLLAYLRTGLSLILAGITLAKLLGVLVVSSMTVLIGMLFIMQGFKSYKINKRVILMLECHDKL